MLEPIHKTAKILIVDDQEANVRLLEKTLSRAGYANLSSIRNPRRRPQPLSKPVKYDNQSGTQFDVRKDPSSRTAPEAVATYGKRWTGANGISADDRFRKKDVAPSGAAHFTRHPMNMDWFPAAPF